MSLLSSASTYQRILKEAGFDVLVEDVNAQLVRIHITYRRQDYGAVYVYRTRSTPSLSFHEVDERMRRFVEEGCFGYRLDQRASRTTLSEAGRAEIYVSTTPAPVEHQQAEEASVGVVTEIGEGIAGRAAERVAAPPAVVEAQQARQALERLSEGVRRPATIHASPTVVQLVRSIYEGRLELRALDDVGRGVVAELLSGSAPTGWPIRWVEIDRQTRGARFAQYLARAAKSQSGR